MFYLGVVATGLFFPAGEDLGKTFDESFPACFYFFFYALKWTLTLARQFQFLGKDKSTVAQRAETTVSECFLTSCV